MVMADTVQRPGGDAAVVRVHGTEKGLAISCDVTPRYCAADPREGAKQAVAECWRNLTAVGADPLAITDCMNFGNPERPEIMGEFVEAVKGMADACTALSFPVVSGNVSLYNETNGVAIPPTPAIGGIGLIPDIAEMATMALKQRRRCADPHRPRGRPSRPVALSGACQPAGYEGAPPPVDLAAERRAGDFVRGADPRGHVSPPCTISRTAACWLRSPRWRLPAAVGVALDAAPRARPAHAVWFGEDQGRYVVAAAPDEAARILQEAAKAGIPARRVGKAAGDALKLPGEAPLLLSSLRTAHERWLPRFMGGS